MNTSRSTIPLTGSAVLAALALTLSACSSGTDSAAADEAPAGVVSIDTTAYDQAVTDHEAALAAAEETYDVSSGQVRDESLREHLASVVTYANDQVAARSVDTEDQVLLNRQSVSLDNSRISLVNATEAVQRAIVDDLAAAREELEAAITEARENIEAGEELLVQTHHEVEDNQVRQSLRDGLDELIALLDTDPAGENLADVQDALASVQNVTLTVRETRTEVRVAHEAYQSAQEEAARAAVEAEASPAESSTPEQTPPSTQAPGGSSGTGNGGSGGSGGSGSGSGSGGSGSGGSGGSGSGGGSTTPPTTPAPPTNPTPPTPPTNPTPPPTTPTPPPTTPTPTPLTSAEVWAMIAGYQQTSHNSSCVALGSTSGNRGYNFAGWAASMQATVNGFPGTAYLAFTVSGTDMVTATAYSCRS